MIIQRVKREDPFMQLYDFYINRGHWLCMDTDRLIYLLTAASIYDFQGKRKDKLHKAVDLIKSTDPELKKTMQLQHFNRYKTAGYGNQ